MIQAKRRAGSWAAKKEPWTFNEITTAMWLDFSNPARRNIIGGRFESVTDVKLTSGVVLSESNASTRPRLDTQVNGLDVARFAGDGLLNTSLRLPLTNYTIYLVQPAMTVSGGSFQGLVSLRNDANFDGGGGNGLVIQRPFGVSRISFNAGTQTSAADPPDAINVYQIRVQNTTVSITTNGKQLVTGTANTNTSALSRGGIGIGYRYESSTPNLLQNPQYQICEIIWVPTAVDTDTGHRAVGQLAHKWGAVSFLPANHPYKLRAPTL